MILRYGRAIIKAQKKSQMKGVTRMDCIKTGQLIRKLRTEKGLTQKELADRMNISDKTVSKWERGSGCPDVSLLNELACLLDTGTETILSGRLEENTERSGNMKRTRFYFCPECGSIITSTGKAEAICCGRRLAPLEAEKAQGTHIPDITEVEDEYFITFPHPMTKEHYIAFVSYVSDSCCFTMRLYPEQTPEFRFPRMRNGRFYFYCTKDGFYSSYM